VGSLDKADDAGSGLEPKRNLRHHRWLRLLLWS
jgi:hypothetical protein